MLTMTGMLLHVIWLVVKLRFRFDTIVGPKEGTVREVELATGEGIT
jgi:hypothetical protein